MIKQSAKEILLNSQIKKNNDHFHVFDQTDRID